MIKYDKSDLNRSRFWCVQLLLEVYVRQKENKKKHFTCKQLICYCYRARISLMLIRPALLHEREQQCWKLSIERAKVKVSSSSGTRPNSDILICQKHVKNRYRYVMSVIRRGSEGRVRESADPLKFGAEVRNRLYHSHLSHHCIYDQHNFKRWGENQRIYVMKLDLLTLTPVE